MRYFFIPLLLIAISCATAVSSETNGFEALVVAYKVSILEEDVDDIYLKYDKQQDVYLTKITFSKSGENKFNYLLKAAQGKQITLILEKKLLVGPIPVKLETINGSFTIIIKDREAATGLLKKLSR